MTPGMLIALLMGFSSGLPLLLTGSLLQAWLKEANVDLGTIGLFGLVGLPYTLKFVWAPVLDRYVPPVFGRRRGWMLSAQVALFVFIAALGTIDVDALARGSGEGWLHPAAYVALVAVGVSFFSATQDIVIDAYRRESLSDAAQAGGAAVYVTGYRVAMLLASGGGLVLADYLDFPLTYLCLAACMVVGMATTMFAPEPVPDEPPPTTLRAAVVEPFSAFFSRRGAIAILIFIVLYKLGDTMAGHLTTPFYLDVGFSKSEIGVIVKAFGFWPTIFGGLLAGAIWAWLGVYRGLMFFGILQGLSTFGFAVLSEVGYDRALLAGVVGFENLTAGMGTTAYLAFMALLTDRRFTATQFALLTSLMGQARVVMTAPTGFLADAMGWTPYFVLCGLIAIPGLMLLYTFKPWLTETEQESTTQS